MNKNWILFILSGITLVLCACKQDTTTIPDDAIVECNGQYLCMPQLMQYTQGLPPEDSAKVADYYIQKWIEDQLILTEVDNNVPALEDQISKYRQELYINYYEQQVLYKMPTQVSDSVINSEYNTHTQNFILQESLAKGILLIIPKTEQIPTKLSNWLQKPNTENLEKIEAFAYQHATGYELFLDKWNTLRSITLHLPINSNELSTALKTGKDQFYLEDSLSTYILQVTDKRMLGEKMPVEYAHDKIIEMALYERQKEFIKNERERLYQNALKKHKISFIYDDQKK